MGRGGGEREGRGREGRGGSEEDGEERRVGRMRPNMAATQRAYLAISVEVWVESITTANIEV